MGCSRLRRRRSSSAVGSRGTMTVTSRSSVAAADVNGLKLDDPRSYRTKPISLRASQGTCRPFTCNLGRLAPGASATVTAVTEATQVGVVVDIVRVDSEEIESNYRNNVAAALARVIRPLTPPAPANICRTLTAAPSVLQSGRSSVVRLTARNRLGKPMSNVAVRASGARVVGVIAKRATPRRSVRPVSTRTSCTSLRVRGHSPRGALDAGRCSACCERRERRSRAERRP